MSNGFGFRCPRCSDTDQIDIQAYAWVRVIGDWTHSDLPHRVGHDFTPDSSALCCRCGWRDRLRSFMPD